MASTQPVSSLRRDHSANESLTQLVHPSGNVEPCADAASPWNRRHSCFKGKQQSFLPQQTHQPSSSQRASALPGVGEPELQASFFYLPANSNV